MVLHIILTVWLFISVFAMGMTAQSLRTMRRMRKKITPKNDKLLADMQETMKKEERTEDEKLDLFAKHHHWMGRMEANMDWMRIL